MIDVETYAAAKKYTDEHGGGGSGDGDMKKSVYDSDLAVANAGGIGAFVSDAVSGKVDKVAGKGLSTNDYDDTEKGKVADNTSAIEAIVNENGCCNILPLNINYMKSINISGTWSNNVYTLDGVTFTVNADNIVVNGTPSRNIDLFISSLSHLKTGVKYTCSAGNNSVSIGTFHMNIPSGGPNTDPDAQKFDFTYNGNQPYVRIIIMANTQVNNEVFYPMLYDARLNPTGYVPYAMTNRELTERVTWKKITTTKSSATYDVGTWNYSAYTVPTGYTPISVYFTGDEELAGQFAITLSVPGVVRICNASNSQQTTALTYSVLCVKL